VKGHNVILFVPGLFGSTLVEESSGDLYFQTFGQALWGNTLALNGDKLGIEDAKGLRAGGILESVTIIPGIYSADAYGESVRYLQTTFGQNTIILPFFYDWRDENIKAVQALGKEVRALKTAGAKKIAIVGHSLGGIITSFYLRYGEQELPRIQETWEGTKYVDAVVVAGTPYRGTIAAYRDLLYGTKVGISKSQLNAVTLGSFPSYYHFLPPIEDYPDVFKAENWPKWKMGLFANIENINSESIQARSIYTEKHLKNGLMFNTLLREKLKKPALAKTPFLSLIGRGHSTLAGVKENTQWITSEEGDGLVTVASALPIQAFKEALTLKHLSMPLEHRGMFTEESVQKEVTQFLRENGF